MRDIKLTDEQKKEFNKMIDEIIDTVLSDEHQQGNHTIDKKKHCPLCIQEKNNLTGE